MTTTSTTAPAEKKRYYNNAPGMFVVMPVEVLLDPRLTDQERRIMMCLCRYANSETGKAEPCYETITECTGIARENASRAVSALVAKGWLERIRLGKGFPNVYFVKIPKNVEFRKVSSKKRTPDEQKEKVAEIRAKIAADNAKAVERFNRGVEHVYKVDGDPTEYPTEEAALAALDAREACEALQAKQARAEAENPVKAPARLPAEAGGVKGQFNNEEFDLEDFKEQASSGNMDEFAGYTRAQLYDMQLNGVKLPQHVIQKNNLDPSM